MKRGFLFGLGSFLIVGVIAGVGEIVKSRPVEGAVLVVILAPLSIVAIRKAKAAPPHSSRLHAVVGWLAGFLCIDVVILAVAMIVWGLS